MKRDEPEDDLELVKACRAGDTAAFGALLERYRRPLFNLALRILGNAEDARELTQQVFLKAFERLDGYDPKYRFYSWIYRIALNESLNHADRRRTFEPLDPERFAGGIAPDERLDRAEKARVVQEALMLLRPEHRTVLVLRHFMDLTYEEIGTVVQLPEKTVKSRLFTARQLLKDVLLSRGVVR